MARFTTEPQHIRPRALVVVCPTEYGGQIEHAAEIAAAAVRSALFQHCIVVTRPGGARAVAGWASSLSVAESLHPRRLVGSRARAALQLLDTQQERRTIRKLLRSLQSRYDVTVLYESSKYGIVRTGRPLTSIAFVHNASPHAADHMTTRDRILFWLERKIARNADRVAVHGESQAALVSRWSSTPVWNVPLPGDSRPIERSSREEEPYALCIGEVRPNKGIEHAIEAVRGADTRLRVIGTPEPPAYAHTLEQLPRGARTTLEFGYLEASDFNATLAGAAVVVLPYTSFAAQSGVLAKAIQYQRSVIASDLPSLREQAADYPNIEFVRVGDRERLKTGIESAMEKSSRAEVDPAREGEVWDDVARTLFS